jgi:hypothetical protein
MADDPVFQRQAKFLEMREAEEIRFSVHDRHAVPQIVHGLTPMNAYGDQANSIWDVRGKTKGPAPS